MNASAPVTIVTIVSPSSNGTAGGQQPQHVLPTVPLPPMNGITPEIASGNTSEVTLDQKKLKKVFVQICESEGKENFSKPGSDTVESGVYVHTSPLANTPKMNKILEVLYIYYVCR